MNNISIISINTIKPLTPTPIPQEARDSDLATNINLNIGGNISITETEERHEYQKTHDTWGGDIGMAALGGAMTGLAGGLGMGAGNMIGGTLSGLALSGASAFGSSNVGAVISENRKGTSNGTYTTNQIGSDIIALNDINITTDNNLNIVGSNLTSLNNTTLNSNNGSVNITTAVETQTTEQTKTKTNWGGIDFTHTNSSVGVGASIERNTTSSTATTQYAKSSNIQSGNNIAISSGNNNSNNSTDTNTKNNNQQQDINIIGSNILAENDIKLNANGDNGNIKIISQELLQNKLDKQKTEAITASVGITNYWAKTADQTHNLIDNSKGGARDSKEGYTNTFFDLGNIGISVMNAAGSPLGFGISADIGYNLIETETAQNNTYNQESSILSNKGSIDLNAENDINIKGSVIATNGEDKEINLTSNNGDISILASKDTTNISSETNTNSVNIDLSLIPTYSYNNSDTTIEQTSYNNSIISANGNNSKINIESKNKDINIKGANIEADNDINLLAQNGNMNIESNQDRYYSNTDTKGFQIGGTIGFNLGKDYQEDITNNYTTIKSNNGNINIDTIEDYNYTYQHAERSGGTFGSTKTMDSIDENNKNIGSNIISNNGSLHLQANNSNSSTNKNKNSNSNINKNPQTTGNINIKGSNIMSETGTNLVAENDVNVFSSIDANRTYRKVEEGNRFTGGELDINENITNTNNSSNIVSNNGNLNIITGRNTNIVASNIATNESGDINILAGYTVDKNTGNISQNTDGTGSINILNTQDLEKNYSYHEEWGGFFDMLANFDIDLDKGGLTLSTSYEQELDENTTLTKTAKTSNLDANNGNINLNATENILSIGTQIYADKDINLSAGYTETKTDEDGSTQQIKHDGNIILTSADNSQSTDSKHEETTVTIGVKVGNSFVDAGYAVDAVVKAGEEVKHAKDELSRMKKLRDEGKASDNAVKDAEVNLAMATANLANSTLGMATAMGSAAASTPTGGFYGSAFTNYDTTTTTSNEQSTWQTHGNLISNSGNINFNTTNDMTQEGTNLYASNDNGTGTINYNIGNDLTIQASKDTYKANSKTENTNVNASIGTNGFSIGAGGGNSKSKTDSITYNNNEVIADNININTKNNANIKGANIEATNDINMNIGNNLNIESLQDTYYSKSSSNSANIGIGSSSISGGYNTEKSYTDSSWVNNQTSIIADNKVDIKVGTKTDDNGNNIAEGNTNLVGSLIASNSDNLNLETNTLTYSDIKDTYYTETKGNGFNTTIGTDPDKGKANIAPMGSTTITMKDTGEEKEQTTKATIGNGKITIANKNIEDIKDAEGNNLYADLNRDVTNSQEITKDLITGALDGSVTIDNRLLFGFIEQNVYERDENGKIIRDKDGKAIVKTDANGNPITTNGYQSIYSDVKNFGTNTAGALVGATGTIINTAKITYDTIADEKSSITDIGNNWKTGQDSLATAIIRGGDDTVKEIMDKINKGEATPEELQYIASRTSKDKDGNLVFTSNGKSIIVEDSDGRVGEQLGFNDKITGQGYIDAGKTATDNKIFYTTDAEERIHKTIESETVAKNMADREVDYYNAMAFLTGGKGIASSNTPNSNNGGLNSQMQSNWNEKYNTNTNQLLNQNTILANNVKSEDKLYSTHFDKNGKAEFINDGDYNAYRKNDDGTLNYENQITYAEGFNLNIADDKKEAFEDQMKTNEVQMDLLRLLLMDSNKSITENTKDLNSLETQYLLGLKTPDGTYYYSWNKFLDKDGTRSKTNEALSNGADDFSLNYLYTNDIWKTIADNSSGISYPTQKTMGAFDIKIDESRTIINPAVGQEVRTKENGTCRTPGCGEKGSLRPGHTHQGTDILLNEGDYVIAPMDGKLYYTTSSKDKTKALNSLAVANDDIRILMLYVDKKSNIKIKKNGTDVEKGGIIGKGTSNSEFIRVYGKDTAQHTHVEQQNANDRLDKKDIQGVLFPNQQRELKK